MCKIKFQLHSFSLFFIFLRGKIDFDQRQMQIYIYSCVFQVIFIQWNLSALEIYLKILKDLKSNRKCICSKPNQHFKPFLKSDLVVFIVNGQHIHIELISLDRLITRHTLSDSLPWEQTYKLSQLNKFEDHFLLWNFSIERGKELVYAKTFAYWLLNLIYSIFNMYSCSIEIKMYVDFQWNVKCLFRKNVTKTSVVNKSASSKPMSNEMSWERSIYIQKKRKKVCRKKLSLGKNTVYKYICIYVHTIRRRMKGCNKKPKKIMTKILWKKKHV